MRASSIALLFGAVAAAASPEQKPLTPLSLANQFIKGKKFEEVSDQVAQLTRKQKEDTIQMLESHLSSKQLAMSAKIVEFSDYLEDVFSTVTTQEQMDHVTKGFSEMLQKSLMSEPKPHVRKHDSEWDHIISGADIESAWMYDVATGEQRREIDGHLGDYSMRTKKVDPSSLGIDKVKQYSGYLDDDKEDKHLFYCECF